MEKDQDLQQHLIELFVIEVRDRLQTLTGWFLELEKGEDAEAGGSILESVYREIHSIKGAARAVTRPDIEAAAQELEEVMSGCKHGDLSLSAECFDLLHAIADEMDSMLSFGEGRKNNMDELLNRLKRLGAGAPEGDPSADDDGGGDVSCFGEGIRKSVAVRHEAGEPATIRIGSEKLEALFRQAEEMIAVKLVAEQRTKDIRLLKAVFEEGQKKLLKMKAPSGTETEAFKAFVTWRKTFLLTMNSQIRDLIRTAERDRRSLGRRVDNLLEESRKIMHFPFAVILQSLPKMVRGISREQGKEIDLEIRGSDIEIDKRILDDLKTPLIHLIRNCIDHGLESPEARVKAGKPLRGRITLAFSRVDSDKVEVVVSDDGRGIDLEEVKAAARKRGIIAPSQSEKLKEEEILALIFQSEVSTSPLITTLSGRGLGLAIVREGVEKIGGITVVESTPAAGTTFRLLLPVTMATFRGVLVQAADQFFIIPTINVERVGRMADDEIRTVENRPAICLYGETVSLVSLADVLELEGGKSEDRNSPDMFPFLVLGDGSHHMAFRVNRILNEQEVLVKSLGRQLLRVRNIGGATVLGSGKVVPVLNVADLLKSALHLPSGTPRPDSASEEAGRDRRRILIVEDSITSRTLLQNILAASGYFVKTAVDGIDALTLLKTEQFSLVVSDIQMPRMDGFHLTEAIRKDEGLRALPVVLVTALESREDRERGIRAGANGYIVKSRFDQGTLLDVIGRLL